MNRQEAEALLPWHMAGTLSAAEAKAVQAFIDSGEIAASELKALKLVAAEVAAVAGDEPSYDPQLLDRVLSQLDTVPQEVITEPMAEVTSAAPREGLLARLRNVLQWQATPTTARWALGAQFALVAALAVLLAAGPERRAEPVDGAYETVAAAAPVATAASFTVAFGDDATLAGVGAELQRLGLKIVNGPSALGLYQLAAAADADLDALQRELDALPGVDLVQRITAVR